MPKMCIIVGKCSKTTINVVTTLCLFNVIEIWFPAIQGLAYKFDERQTVCAFEKRKLNQTPEICVAVPHNLNGLIYFIAAMKSGQPVHKMIKLESTIHNNAA